MKQYVIKLCGESKPYMNKKQAQLRYDVISTPQKAGKNRNDNRVVIIYRSRGASGR